MIELNEKAKSKAQQRFMGAVLHAQRTGEASTPEVADAADSMKVKDVEDFASTKHKGLPEKKKKKEDVDESLGSAVQKVLDARLKQRQRREGRKPQKAMDAGARAKRLLQRKEYAAKVSGSTDNVPDDIRDHKTWDQFKKHI